jgi:hypothetical protein
MSEYANYSEYLRHPRFRSVVDYIFRRANQRCENSIEINGEVARCERKATEPHHIKYCKWGEFDTPENLIAVCHECHCVLHTCDSCGGTLKAEAIKANRTICFACFQDGAK